MSKDKKELKQSIDQVRAALAAFEATESNELSSFHVARQNLLNALGHAVVAIGDELT